MNYSFKLKHENWNEWKLALEKEDQIIFNGYDKTKLTNREKRKIIFDYLCKKERYDWDFLKKMRSGSNRNPSNEIYQALESGLGVCNSIAQLYKLLLYINDIYSVCVVCKIEFTDEFGNTKIEEHMLNLVYDEETCNFSFDDVTMTVIEKENSYIDYDKYFDYDLETANEYGQAKEEYFDSKKLVLYNTAAVFDCVNCNDTSYKKYGYELDEFSLDAPTNIASFGKKDIKK